MAKLTTTKLHSIIRKATGNKCSKFSPSQKIDRTTYDINTMFKGFYGIISGQNIIAIRDAVKEAGLVFDESEISRGFIKVKKFQ